MSSKKRARGKNTAVNTKKKLKGLPENKKNKVWTDEEMNLYARVLANTDTREHSWLYQLENYALKKHANEELFIKIQEEFEDASEEDSVEYRFTIDQLRTKYKWFKKEWRRINHKIKSGTGLGGKDTTTPSWYDVLNPHFCQAVDNMTSVLTKANDLRNSSDEDQSKSDDSDSDISNNSLDNSFELDTAHLINTSGEMSDTSTKGSIASGSANALSNADDIEQSEESTQSSTAVTKVKKLTKRSPKKTNIKFHSRRNSKPKSQSEAMVQVAKSIENSSVQQEQNKDARLKALLEADRKRDEMFLAYQREQADELLMAQLLLQPRPSNVNMQCGNYRNSFPNDLPLSSAGNSWNTLDPTPHGQDIQDANYRYHQL